MIDEIFAMIMKEARSRKGKTLISNISFVLMEINSKVRSAMEDIRDEERRKKNDEGQTGDIKIIL